MLNLKSYHQSSCDLSLFGFEESGNSNKKKFLVDSNLQRIIHVSGQIFHSAWKYIVRFAPDGNNDKTISRLYI